MNRLPMSPIMRQRTNGLIKQAEDALNIAAEERLNLDSESRRYLDEARQAVGLFDFVVHQQPVRQI